MCDVCELKRVEILRLHRCCQIRDNAIKMLGEAADDALLMLQAQGITSGAVVDRLTAATKNAQEILD